MDLKQRLARVPVLGRLLLGAFRLRLGAGYLLPSLGSLLRWTFRSREVFNYTYDLTPLNRAHLAAFIANAAGVPAATVLGLFAELEGDEALRAHLRDGVRNSPERFLADPEPRYGRRLGWYALARLLKPRLVVETGVDKGLGSCVLCSALLRNRAEGHPGEYIGTEINPRCGYLLAGPYAAAGRIAYGDSLRTLESLEQPIGMFINDSDHSADYEEKEYRAVARLLGSTGVIVGDNAHDNDRLLRFCAETGRRFSYFQEKPAGHWYPGAGIGLGMPAPVKS